MTAQSFNDSCSWLSDRQRSVPLVRMTFPNPINVVLLPKASQVHCFSLQRYCSVSTVKCALSEMWGIIHASDLWQVPSKKGFVHHIHQGAHNVIKTHCSLHRFVWPRLCLCNGFSLLERVLYRHLWNTALGETTEHTFLDCSKEKNEFANTIYCTV